MGLNYPGRRMALLHNLSEQNMGVRGLLDKLSTKELSILGRHPDLLARVKAIRKLPISQLEKELEDKFGLEVHYQRNGACYQITPDKALDFLPAWIDAPVPEALAQNAGDFINWAEEFLMQEVRINIWIRYIEYKKKLGALGCDSSRGSASGMYQDLQGILYL